MKGIWLFPMVVVLSIVALIASACPAPAPVAPVEVVKIGALQDMTGATSDVGADEAKGVAEAFTYFNDQGGINGKPLKMFQYDYGYRVPEAVTTYTRFRDYDKVIAVLGWGTGDTEALKPTINKDKIVYLSSSFSGHLTDPAETPYNFVFSTDYSTNARATIQYWYDNYWLKDPRYKEEREAGVKPRFVFFGMFGSPYATAPVEAIKDQAKILGFDFLPDQDVSLWALDTKSQVLAVSENPPHFVWHGNTTMSVATTLRDFYALGLTGPGKKTMHGSNVWGFDENLIKLAGPAAEEALGAHKVAFFMWDYPMRATVHEYAQKLNPGVPLENRLIHTVGGWLKVNLMVEALTRMDNAGELDVSPGALATTRAKLKSYFEMAPMDDIAKLYGLAEYTVTPTDHRPGGKIAMAQIEGGKFVSRGFVDMKGMYSDLWAGWLGW